jgi:hypothetical protein
MKTRIFHTSSGFTVLTGVMMIASSLLLSVAVNAGYKTIFYGSILRYEDRKKAESLAQSCAEVARLRLREGGVHVLKFEELTFSIGTCIILLYENNGKYITVITKGSALSASAVYSTIMESSGLTVVSRKRVLETSVPKTRL